MREVRLLLGRRVVCATREENTRCDNVNTWMTCANTLLLLIQTQTAIQECAVTSLVSMRSVSVCAVSPSVIHVVLRSIPYHNQRVWCLTFCKQRVLVQSRNLAGTTLPRDRLRVAKGCCVTTCRLYRHSFLGLDHDNALIMRRDFTTNIKHVLPAHHLETYTSVMSR